MVQHKIPTRNIIAVLFAAIFFNKPTYLIARNIISPNTPSTIIPKYKCSPEILNDITIVISVKDTCSQTPIFMNSLRQITNVNTPVIYTHPAYKACSKMHKGHLSYWNNVRTISVDLSDSPMSGWVRASKYINTKYSYLVHNDGYALNANFLCELYGALSSRSADYIIAAPMLYENKEGGGLGAHATQSKLQLTPTHNKYGKSAFHKHSFINALNRGNDLEEGDQSEFLEDHGFLIKSTYILDVVDDQASFTLEYLDMILNIRNIGKKIVFVPSASLEFRVTEFLLQDIPYFAYKRSEEIAHRTRDYISTKWSTGVPNTGFWTYIKYTILEQHEYSEQTLNTLSWREQLSCLFGFFQIVGYNRYKWSSPRYIPMTKVVNLLDDTRMPPANKYIAWRKTQRPIQNRKHMNNISKLVDYGQDSVYEMEYEYSTFVVYKTEYKCDASIPDICNVIIAGRDICICWGHTPIFKQSSLIEYIKPIASLIKIPSRVSTYMEMLLYRTHSIRSLTDQLKTGDTYPHLVSHNVNLTLYECESDSPDCLVPFQFKKYMRMTYFSGKPIHIHNLRKFIQSAFD